MKEVFKKIGSFKHVINEERSLINLTFLDRIKLHLTKCSFCKSRYAWKSYRKTSYEDDDLNFDVLCKKCWRRDDAFNEERWNDYYSDRL